MKYGEDDAVFGSQIWGIDLELLTDLMAARPDDRTAAIICVSYLEKYLGELLKVRLSGLNSETRDLVFRTDGVLGPFAARAHVARGLELISAQAHQDVRVLAKIRNKFAHDISVTSFNNPEVSKLVENLKHRPSKDKISFFGRESGGSSEFENFPSFKPRRKFEITCIAYIFRLYLALEQPKLAGLLASHEPSGAT